jgi:hypothetical protein
MQIRVVGKSTNEACKPCKWTNKGSRYEYKRCMQTMTMMMTMIIIRKHANHDDDDDEVDDDDDIKPIWPQGLWVPSSVDV